MRNKPSACGNHFAPMRKLEITEPACKRNALLFAEEIELPRIGRLLRDRPTYFRLAILDERRKGTAVTLTSDLCRGREDIAELKRLRDCSEAIYRASQEAINVYKLRIRMLDAQIARVWNSGNVTQGGYL